MITEPHSHNLASWPLACLALRSRLLLRCPGSPLTKTYALKQKYAGMRVEQKPLPAWLLLLPFYLCLPAHLPDQINYQ